jgi:transposase
MTKYSSTDIKKAVGAYYQYNSFRTAAQETGIPKSAIHRWVQNVGERVTDKRKGRKVPNKKCLYPKELADDVNSLFQQSATTSVLDIHHQVRQKYGNSLSTTRRVIKKLGLTRKKVSCILNPPMTPERLEKMKIFRKKVESISIDDILSVDEASFDSRMRATHGYSPKGQRIKHAETTISRNRHSLTCGVSAEKIESHHIVEGSMNTEEFLVYLKNMLPSCNQKHILLDNVKFHQNKEVLKVFAEHGKEVIFVPPYSPQFNPIEHVFSSMKKQFRNLREREMTYAKPLTIDQLDDFVHAYIAQSPDWKKTFHCCLVTRINTLHE